MHLFVLLDMLTAVIFLSHSKDYAQDLPSWDHREEEDFHFPKCSAFDLAAFRSIQTPLSLLLVRPRAVYTLLDQASVQQNSSRVFSFRLIDIYRDEVLLADIVDPFPRHIRWLSQRLSPARDTAEHVKRLTSSLPTPMKFLG